MSSLSLRKPANSNIPSPFRGKPPTTLRMNKNGEAHITVQLRALTPWRARLSLYTAIGTSAALFVSGNYGMAIDGSFTLEAFVKLTCLSAAAFPTALFGLRRFIQRSATVRFTQDQISVQKLFGCQQYERSHPHAFVLLPHDKADKERDRHAFRDRKRRLKWWSWDRRKYYGNSSHVVLECFGERHDILTVYDRKKAAAFQARLQACDAVMDGIDIGGSGVSLSPDTDWNVSAGGL